MGTNGNRFEVGPDRRPSPDCHGYPPLVVVNHRHVPTCGRCGGLLQANGPVEDIDGSGMASYHLGDALGSTRGLTDGSGAVTGALDYDVFGATRTASGATTALTFTGQQTDAETGFTFLRSRYLDPAAGRFTTADRVQPNAPGTQGYNLYAYVANNPTRWADPSGHVMTSSDAAALATYLVSSGIIATIATETGAAVSIVLPATATLIVPLLFAAVTVLVCAMTPGCWDAVQTLVNAMMGNESSGQSGTGPTTGSPIHSGTGAGGKRQRRFHRSRPRAPAVRGIACRTC